MRSDLITASSKQSPRQSVSESLPDETSDQENAATSPKPSETGKKGK